MAAPSIAAMPRKAGDGQYQSVDASGRRGDEGVGASGDEVGGKAWLGDVRIAIGVGERGSRDRSRGNVVACDGAGGVRVGPSLGQQQSGLGGAAKHGLMAAARRQSLEAIMSMAQERALMGEHH